MLAEMIKNEHPQIVAMIFAYMEPEQADALIQYLPEELVEQVIPRLATLDSIPPAAIRELNESIEDLLAGEAQQARVNVGGVGIAAKILNRIDNKRVESILKQISTVDAELAQRIEHSMFVFEDLIHVDDRNFQILLRSVDQKLLVSALKGAEPTLHEQGAAATCRNGRPRCCATISARAARCGSARSRRPSARSSRRRSASNGRGRSSSAPTPAKSYRKDASMSSVRIAGSKAGVEFPHRNAAKPGDVTGDGRPDSFAAKLSGLGSAPDAGGAGADVPGGADDIATTDASTGSGDGVAAGGSRGASGRRDAKGDLATDAGDGTAKRSSAAWLSDGPSAAGATADGPVSARRDRTAGDAAAMLAAAAAAMPPSAAAAILPTRTAQGQAAIAAGAVSSEGTGQSNSGAGAGIGDLSAERGASAADGSALAAIDSLPRALSDGLQAADPPTTGDAARPIAAEAASLSAVPALTPMIAGNPGAHAPNAAGAAPPDPGQASSATIGALAGDAIQTVADFSGGSGSQAGYSNTGRDRPLPIVTAAGVTAAGGDPSGAAGIAPGGVDVPAAAQSGPASADAASARVADRVSDQVIRLLANSGREAVVRLHPPDLGEVTVRIAVNGRDVSAWFGSPQAQVQQTISAAIGQLHTDLGNAGYNAERRVGRRRCVRLGTWRQTACRCPLPRRRHGPPNSPRPGRRLATRRLGGEHLCLTPPRLPTGVRPYDLLARADPGADPDADARADARPHQRSLLAPPARRAAAAFAPRRRRVPGQYRAGQAQGSARAAGQRRPT